MIVAGVGCKRGAPAGDIEAAIRAALAHANVSADALGAVATIAAKSTERGVKAAAEKFGIALVPVSATEIKAASDRIETRSARVLALVGVPAVAEGAALAAAGPTARLICPRLAIGAATCALAIAGAAT